MIGRLTGIALLISAITAVLSYLISVSSLPPVFYLYALVIAAGIGLFSFGSIMRPILELKDLVGAGTVQELEATVRRTLEESSARLRELENRYESLLKATSSFAWVFEVEDGIIVNSSSAGLLGYEDFEVVGKRVEEIFEVFGREAVARKKDGSLARLEVSSFGNVYVARDEEEKRKLEKELAFLRAVVEHSVDAIVVTDIDSRIVAWNKGAETLLGYRAEEVIGKPLSVILPEEERERCRENFRRAVTEGFVKEVESSRITKDGRRIIVEQTLTSISVDGDIVGFVAIMRDITKRKETEEELRRICVELERRTRELSEYQRELEHLAKIVETSNDAIYSVNASGIITAWNKTAEKLFGWRKEEIIGRSASILLPEEIKNETEIVLRRLREGEKELRFETRRLHKNGKVVPVEVTISPIEPSSGFSVIARVVEGEDFERRLFRFNVERGRTYFTRSLDVAVEVLRDLSQFGYRAVVVGRRYPEELGFDADIYWVSERGDVNPDVSDIYELLIKLPGWKNAVLLDIDCLLSSCRFEDVYTMLQKVKDAFFILKKGVVVVHSASIGEEEEKLIKIECPEVTAKELKLPPEELEVLRIVYEKNRMGSRPSIKDVMSELGITRNTAKKRINSLASRGLLRVIKDGRAKVLEVSEEARLMLR